MRFHLRSLAILACVIGAGFTSQAEVAVHPIPDPAKDSPYTVTVGGVSVPVEKAGAIQGAYYARFRTDGAAKAEITVKGGGIKAECKPQAADFAVAGNRLTFKVESQRRHIITATAGGKPLWPLIIIAESELQQAPHGKVFNVQDYLTDPAKVQTSEIQKALDACAKEGGTVVFAPGTYRTGTIRIGDGTTVYLAPGALIVGSDNPADYPVDEGRKEIGTHGPVCSFSRLIFFDHAKNSRLIGHGVIDGRGHILRNKHQRHVQLVDVTGCEYVQIENVVLRNSAEWTLHILASKDVTVDNLSIINDWGVENTDGIDPDGSTDVSIANYLAFCGDDAVAIKTTGNSGLLKPVMGVTVSDSVLMTKKTALKVGTETYADVSGVRFTNCKVVNSSRGCAVYARDGGKISDVVFEDIELDLREYEGENKGGEPVRLEVSPRHALGAIDGVTFENIVCRAPYSSVLQGNSKSSIKNVAFKNMRLELLNRTTRAAKVALFGLSHSSNVSFDGVSVNRSATNPELWGGLTWEKNCAGITQRGIIGLPQNAESARPGKQ